MRLCREIQAIGTAMMLSMTLLSGVVRGAEARDAIRIHVESKELHKIDSRIFGQFLERPSWGETGPEIAAGTNGNLRAEIVEMLRTMRIPIVRFPGGTDVDYIDWTDMVSNAPGRDPERPVTTGHTGQKVTNRFGYDEYLRLAGELGWDSILVVNFLDGLAKKKPLAEAARHAAGLVAYANAPGGAKLPAGMPDWPAVRAKNGHPAPYGVKIFQLGNEWWCGRFPEEVKKAMGASDSAALAPWYRECIVAYADAMRAVDPNIEFIMDGQMGNGVESLLLTDPELKNRVRYLARHFYAPFGAIVDAKRDGAPVPRETLKPSDWWLAWATMPGFYDDAGNCQGFGIGLNTFGYEIAATEWNWNGWGGDKVESGAGLNWRHAAAIGCAGFLNGLLRQADKIRIANQSMLVGHSWGIAAIRVDPTGKMPTHYNAQGAATTFYNRHHGDRVLAMRTENAPFSAQPYSVNWPDPRPRVTLLDVVATRNDKVVFVHAINRSFDADLEADLDLAALAPPDGPAVLHVLEGTPADQVATRKSWMSERSQPVEIAGGKARVAFPRRAVAILEVPLRREKPAGARLQEFIENARCYASLPRHAHKPDFQIVRVKEKKYRDTHSWITDAGQKIGLLNLWLGEIEMFRFFPPAGGARVEYKMPAVHHWATLQGPRICIVPQGTWTNRGEMAYLQDKGELIRLRYSENLGGNTQMVHRFTLRFDAVLGYLWDCVFEMQMDTPQRFEYANLLTGGLADSRDERKRYQKCVWTRRDGAVCYMYQNPLSMMQGAGPEWTDMPEDSGFVGWVAERDMNPFLEIIRSTPRTRFGTCSVWYDQHVFALPPEQKGDDGLYHITAAYRLLSLPLPVAKELEDAARTMLPADTREGPMGFRQGIVNDFETLIPAGTLYNGCMWGHSAKYDGTTGHSGTHSLRLNGGETAQPIHGGTPIFVETAKRYRLSAWVRTRGVTGKGAFLRVNEVFWGWDDVRAAHTSKFLTGDNDWTQLQIEFKPIAGDPFAVPGLVVDGRGAAWFDDIELVEIPR